MLLALAPAAFAADLPPALDRYEQAVEGITAAVTAALPRLAACKAIPGDKLVFQVDLKGVPAVTTGVLTGASRAKVAAPCHEKVVAEVFTRSRPVVGNEAAVVLDVAGGAPRLDGDVGLFGTLATDAVEAGIRARMDGVAQCYVNGVHDTPGLEGEVVVSFAVLPTGHVLTADLKRSTLASPPVEACVLAEVRRATFAAPQAGAIARVTYPFTFKPQGTP